MTRIFLSLSFIWLLPLTASSAVTMGHHPNLTDVMTTKVTGSDFTLGYPTAQEASTTKPSSEASATSSSPSATNFKPSQSHNSAAGVESTMDGHLQITTSAMTLATDQASNPTATMTAPPTPSSSTQSPDEEKTRASQWTSDKTTYLSTQLNPTAATSDMSTGSNPVTVGAGTHSYKPSTVTSKKPIIHITRPKKENLSKKGRNHSEAVAGIIGGALVLMMLGFLVIFIKKRKLQKQQITTKEWAGPSPFLEGGSDDGHVTVRSSNRISLSTFLPQRLSKRFSLISEADKELEDMTAGTFGDKHQQVDGDNARGSIGAIALPEMKNTEDIPEMVESSVSLDSSKANHCLSTGDLSEAAQLSPEATSPHPLSKTVENPDKVPN